MYIVSKDSIFLKEIMVKTIVVILRFSSLPVYIPTRRWRSRWVKETFEVFQLYDGLTIWVRDLSSEVWAAEYIQEKLKLGWSSQ